MVGMCSKWVFWDATRWVFYIDIFKRDNLEGSSPEREVSADREGRSCLSDSCCEASVIQRGKALRDITKKIYSFHPLPQPGFSAAVPASFPLFSSAHVLLMFLVGCFSRQSSFLLQCFLDLFILISPLFPVRMHLGEIFFLDSRTTGWFLHAFFSAEVLRAE